MKTPRPDGWPLVIPRIVTHDIAGLVQFVKKVFGAKGSYREERPAEMLIGDSIVLISGPAGRKAMAAFLYVYVDDADKTYRRAIKAGARSVEEPQDMPYGDRRAMVEDAWGNLWQIATYRDR
jgi:PhnB protein